jgi:hypothetical protein
MQKIPFTPKLEPLMPAMQGREPFFWNPEELAVDENGLKDITDAQIPIFAHCLAVQYFLDHDLPFTETKAKLITSIERMRNDAIESAAEALN